MTERESGDDRDYPDGSVGRYVREQWGAAAPRTSKATRPYVGPVQPVPEPVEPDSGPDTGVTDEAEPESPATGNGRAMGAVPPLQAPPNRPVRSVPPPTPPATPPAWAPSQSAPAQPGPAQPASPQPASPQPGPPRSVSAGPESTGSFPAARSPIDSAPVAQPRSRAAARASVPHAVPPPARAYPVDSPPRGVARWTDPAAMAARRPSRPAPSGRAPTCPRLGCCAPPSARRSRDGGG